MAMIILSFLLFLRRSSQKVAMFLRTPNLFTSVQIALTAVFLRVQC